MARTQAANPSIFVLDLTGASRRRGVARTLIDELQGEDGDPLAPLGGNRFALARPLAKALQRRHQDLQAWLQTLPGVRRVRRLRADQVVALYGTRDPAATDHRPHAARSAPRQRPWHFRQLRVDAARALLARERPGALADIRLALIDTGIAPHSCYGDWQGLENERVRLDLGLNLVDAGMLPRDPVEAEYPGQPGHGTRIGSVIAARNEDEFLGVASGVTLVPYRLTNNVLINFMGNETPLHEALEHARNNSACQVANISLGDPCVPGRKIGRAFDEAYEAGMIVVAAAGNVTSEVTYPARHARVIAAGGSTRRREPWSGGSRGWAVDVCAPANGISRADWQRVGGTWQSVYGGGGDGTSYASAHVSGLAALWLARWRHRLGDYPHRWQIVEAFRSVLRRTCHRPEGWNTGLFGAGIVDALALLQADLPAADSLRYEDDRAENDLM